MNSQYFQHLTATLDGVVKKLAAKGIQPHRLAFGGEGPKPGAETESANRCPLRISGQSGDG